MRQYAARWRNLLVVGEALTLMGSVYVAVFLRYIASDDPLHAYVGPWLVLFRAGAFMLFVMVGLTAMGLHQVHLRESWFGILARQMVGCAMGWVGLVILYYLVPWLHVGRGLLLIAMLVSFMLLTLVRWLFGRMVHISALQQRVVVLGAGKRAAIIPQRMRRQADRMGFKLVAFLARQGEDVVVPREQVVILDCALDQWVSQHDVDEIVVAVDDRRGGLPMDELLACRERGVDVTELSTFIERESGRLQLSLTDPSWLIFSDGFDVSPWRRLSKRTFDLGIAMLLVLPGLPLMAVTALAILLESGPRRPLLYRQQRVGERGRLFSVIKFRSMRTDAEADGVARWASKDDQRVTRVGRLIRKTRLDELPQLWNILHGDMSFIGPRPERPEFVEKLSQEIRYYQLRHAVKPGLTGWAQLRYPYGASVKDAEEKLKYDLFYVKNHNLLFDLAILIQTVEVILFGRGAR
ncbi:MAG: TIGR03013 family XrtA/PEP-CTERM system glycosyltransferase [Rhodanobacteraceae bacterium]